MEKKGKEMGASESKSELNRVGKPGKNAKRNKARKEKKKLKKLQEAAEAAAINTQTITKANETEDTNAQTEIQTLNKTNVGKDLELERQYHKERRDLIAKLQEQILRLQAMDEKDGPEEGDEGLIDYSDMESDLGVRQSNII
ncbi:hypothetical protein N7493_008235 [Penicillium malachiteum]|uniref:Uncharacterized protein n=1 Tax=Penicillium malachiteum TaxID=1324776 RepID=A0AAD6HHF9_9EURO|nr:hypothetical protein N7493_008235 [Penicillium malachiteum]